MADELKQSLLPRAKEITEAHRAYEAYKQKQKEAWKEKSCAKCTYNIHSHCRRFPPSIKESSYPWVIVMVDHEKYAHQLACAEYEEVSNG